jgi:hypothetical protein
VRRKSGKLKQRYGGKRRRDLSTAIGAVAEPQHGSHLEPIEEHGQTWVSCRRCGRQWAIHGSHADVITDGDGYCDEHPEDIAAAVRYYAPGRG